MKKSTRGKGTLLIVGDPRHIPGTSCAFRGCTNPPTHRIVAELRESPGGPPATLDVNTVVCDAHVDAVKDDLWTDAGFAFIGDQFERAGYARPIKSYSSVSVEPIIPPTVQ